LARLATISGVRQYVIFLTRNIVGVNTATGELLWRYAKIAEGSPANIQAPIVDGDRIYTGSGPVVEGWCRLNWVGQR